MSNVKKPEPFGYVRDGNLGGSLVFQHKISEMDALVSSTMPLYSPDQMDSYAAERVREALEQAAGICDRFADRGMHPAECAGAIRALITKE